MTDLLNGSVNVINQGSKRKRNTTETSEPILKKTHLKSELPQQFYYQ
jgi:hypothetical protein